MKHLIIVFSLLFYIKGISQPNLVPYQIKNQITFYNNSTKKLFKQKWDSVYMFNENVAWVKTVNKWGLIDTTEQYLYPIQLDEISYFIQNKARVKKDNHWFWINTKGALIEKDTFIIMTCGGSQGYGSLCVGQYKKDNKYGLIINGYNQKTKTSTFDTMPAIYDKLLGVYGTFIKTQINNKVGLTSTVTGKIITKHIYDVIEFNNTDTDGSVKALHQVTKNGKIGFINQKGKLVISCKYKTATTFYNGLSFVSLENGISYYINHKGFEYYSK